MLKPFSKLVRVSDNKVKENEDSKDYYEIVTAFKVVIHTVVIPLLFATFVSILSAIVYYVFTAFVYCIIFKEKRKYFVIAFEFEVLLLFWFLVLMI